MQFLDLLLSIEKAKIKHLVVGGVAINLHGIERLTKDIDLVVYLEKKNILKFLKLMALLGFRPILPTPAIHFADPVKRAEWIRNKNMLVFSFYHKTDPMKVVDVFVRHPLPFASMYKRRLSISIGSSKIPVIGIQDLIKLKQKAGRLQDRSDVRALQKALKVKKEKNR